MGVYIKGMKITNACFDCPINEWCIVYREYKGWRPVKERLDECPLVEIPEPHGRLVDADDVKSRMIPLSSFSVQDWISEVELSNCRTVIEAEGE